jgi:hypothetical protein
MLLVSIPFDYAKLLDPGDRVRRTRNRRTDTRARPIPPNALKD